MTDGFDNKLIHARIRLKLPRSRNEFFHEFRIQCISRSLEFFYIRLLR